MNTEVVRFSRELVGSACYDSDVASLYWRWITLGRGLCLRAERVEEISEEDRITIEEQL